ncbi:MAG TPA: metallophosphoesterase family protein [Vicinamibacterales bacterium]
MRYLVLSDIHANIDALEAVLTTATPETYDGVLLLGDLVGYGAEPNLVVDRMSALSPLAAIRGNHDKVATGLESAEGFNPAAARAARWTRDTLTDRTRDYLRGLQKGPLIVDDLVEICHGSPIDEDAYVFGELDAAEALNATRRPVCLFGHTHIPMGATLSPVGTLDMIFHGAHGEGRIELDPGLRYLFNPGSVGQPRDGDPRAAFALLDTGLRAIEFRRVAYPVERARDRIIDAGLPKPLGLRLLQGR